MGGRGGLASPLKNQLFLYCEVGRIDIKAFPVVSAKSEFFDGGPVLTGAIPFVAVPAIVGEFFM